MKKFILIFIAVLGASFTAKAQDSFENILLADSGDAQKLLQAYFNPAMKGFIFGMSNGWYHTAKVHKKFGFDLSFGVSAGIAPSKDEFFNIATLGLTSITTSATEAPTFSGPDNTSVLMTVNTTIQGQAVNGSFNFPNGIKGRAPLGLNTLPVPFAQINLGLPFKIDGMLRVIPKASLGDNGNVDLLGFGLKKEITNWFGPLDKLPLHISLLAAYTKLNVEYGIDDSNSGDLLTNNALGTFSLTAFTVEAIGSLNFPFINIFGGFGYSKGTSDFKMSGTYTAVYDTGLPAPNDTVTRLLTPPNLTFNASGFKTTVGTRFSLGFLKIFGSYTMQEYNSINAGIAISIR